MTPARERLLRLALAMPEEGVETIARSIVWICPGLANAKLPVFVQPKAALLAAARDFATDPKLLQRLTHELHQLKAQPHEPRPRRDNVVPLFGGSEGPEAV